MRAMNLAVLIIVLEMSIGFMSGIGYYEDKPYYAPSQGIEYIVKAQDNSSTGAVVPSNSLSASDYLTFGIDWVLGGFLLIIEVMKAFFAISWILYGTYHLPMVVCVFVQGIVYMIYTWAIIQWRSGRGGGGFE